MSSSPTRGFSNARFRVRRERRIRYWCRRSNAFGEVQRQKAKVQREDVIVPAGRDATGGNPSPRPPPRWGGEGERVAALRARVGGLLICLPFDPRWRASLPFAVDLLPFPFAK